MSAQVHSPEADFATSPLSLPPRDQWAFGCCVCCDRETVVAPGPRIVTGDGRTVELPYCQDGFERAARHLHRLRIRARRRSQAPSA
ncbi:hypothetical protein [Kitasatospora sp. LaBMicrA B282]|uniref:hypothetical protein n=1 Tax=Kitasatospora sp. LaBMicrA B282 TaxID=3420949 RepID=UPI003D0C56F3